jgi:hypothetical protein
MKSEAKLMNGVVAACMHALTVQGLTVLYEPVRNQVGCVLGVGGLVVLVARLCEAVCNFKIENI